MRSGMHSVIMNMLRAKRGLFPHTAAKTQSSVISTAMWKWYCRQVCFITGPQQEAFIAYKRCDEKVGLKAGQKLIKGMFAGSSFGEVVRMLSILGSGGSSSIEKKLKKKKQKYLFVGLVCVREEYQRQGYMRKALELAFAEGNRLGLPVVLDTDAKLKSDKYRHLGMELAGVRTCKNGSKLYELIKYPDSTV